MMNFILELFSKLTTYDIVFIIIILVSVIFATIRGGVSEILSLSTWFISLWLMHRFGTILNQYLPNSISNHMVRMSIVYSSIFLIVAILIAIIKKLANPAIKNTGLNGVNHFIGFVFGVIRGLLICALIILIIDVLSFDKTQSIKQ